MTSNDNTPATRNDQPAVYVPGSILRPVANITAIIEHHDEVTQIIKKAMSEGRDYGLVPGTKKETLFKAGAELMMKVFGLRPEFETEEKEIDHDREYRWIKSGSGRDGNSWTREGVAIGVYRYVRKCKLVNRATGEVVGEGSGMASSLETKYMDRPRDTENTVLKMADKRSLVAAVLLTFGLSDRFTQDTEDAPTEEAQVVPVGEPGPAPKPASAGGESAGQRLRRLMPEDLAVAFETRALAGRVSWSKVAGAVPDDATVAVFFQKLEEAIHLKVLGQMDAWDLELGQRGELSTMAEDRKMTLDAFVWGAADHGATGFASILSYAATVPKITDQPGDALAAAVADKVAKEGEAVETILGPIPGQEAEEKVQDPAAGDKTPEGDQKPEDGEATPTETGTKKQKGKA